MKKAFAFFSISILAVSLPLMFASSAFAEERNLSYEVSKNITKDIKSNNKNIVDEDVEVEKEDADNVAPNPDAVEQSEDVEEYKGDIEALKNSDKKQDQAVKSEDGEEAPPAEDEAADEKYQQALHECEQKADESGDFNDSLRKCMFEKGLADDLKDAESNVF